MTQENISAACRELDDVSGQSFAALQARKWDDCGHYLRQYFYQIRYKHAYGLLPDPQLTPNIQKWEGQLMQLAGHVPDLAFLVAMNARQECANTKEELKELACDVLIVNTVCSCIIALARPALDEWIAHRKYLPFGEVTPYIKPVIDVMILTAPHFRSQALQHTFYEALTVFEKMLYSSFMSPVTRYALVMQMRDWADQKKPNCGALLNRMNEILDHTTPLPNGQGMILLPLEEQADRLANDHRSYQEPKPTPISVAFAIRAGVPAEHAALYDAFEGAMQKKKYQTAGMTLYQLFRTLSLETDQAQQKNAGNHNRSLAYLVKAAERLTSESVEHGFNLAICCIDAIDEGLISSESLQAAAYRFSLSAIERREKQSGDYAETCHLNLAIMKKSADFYQVNDSQEIFERAASAYREYLVTLQPASRYDVVKEMDEGLAEQEYLPSLLQSFVNSLLSGVKAYGPHWGIPMEEDVVDEIIECPQYAP